MSPARQGLGRFLIMEGYFTGTFWICCQRYDFCQTFDLLLTRIWNSYFRRMMSRLSQRTIIWKYSKRIRSQRPLLQTWPQDFYRASLRTISLMWANPHTKLADSERAARDLIRLDCAKRSTTMCLNIKVSRQLKCFRGKDQTKYFQMYWRTYEMPLNFYLLFWIYLDLDTFFC